MFCFVGTNEDKVTWKQRKKQAQKVRGKESKTSVGQFSLGDPVLSSVITLRINCSHFCVKTELKIGFNVHTHVRTD
jgi:hypothetical protein